MAPISGEMAVRFPMRPEGNFSKDFGLALPVRFTLPSERNFSSSKQNILQSTVLILEKSLYGYMGFYI